MSSTRLYWDLIDTDLLLEFVQWLRKEYPVTFKHLVEQFIAFNQERLE